MARLREGAVRGGAAGLAYLGRYTHRVGISNARLIRYDGEAVTFATKDGLSCTLHAVDFLGRLLRHTLPRASTRSVTPASSPPATFDREPSLAHRPLLGNTIGSARVAETSERASPRTWVELMLALNASTPCSVRAAARRCSCSFADRGGTLRLDSS
ncbi:MAG: transposase [Sandaracinaceae bacterium]|nr:transposase [Sandaracinaceae bacterium]